MNGVLVDVGVDGDDNGDGVNDNDLDNGEGVNDLDYNDGVFILYFFLIPSKFPPILIELCKVVVHLETSTCRLILLLATAQTAGYNYPLL